VSDERYRFLTRVDGPVTAVADGHASASERQRMLSDAVARRILAELDRNASRGDILSLFKVASSGAPHRMRNLPSSAVASAIRDAYDDGDFALIAGWDVGGATSAAVAAPAGDATPAQSLALRAMADRTEIPFEGRRYRIVATAVADPSSNGMDNFRTVPLAEARPIIDRMAARASTPQDRALWKQVVASLSDKSGDTSLRLLRDTPASGMGKPDEAPAPAAPTQRETKRDWIEIEIVYDHGRPYDGNCHVQLPSGAETDGAPDEDGVVRIDGLLPGSCRVSFPDLDASVWDPG
jgi:hypothetical protein